MRPKCNLIVDSCCDLPFSAIDQEGVVLVEFPYVVDGMEKSDDLFRSVSAHEFFERMRRVKDAHPTTSQLPAVVLEQVFRRALESGVPTVYLGFSSGLSGSFDMAALLRDRLVAEYGHGELYVVDTQLASIAEGLLVEEAIRQRSCGLSAKELVAWAEEARFFVNARFMVDDLESLRRGGRIPRSAAFAGAKLDVKPILSIDAAGRLSACGMARGRKKGIRQMAAYYEKRFLRQAPARRVILAGSDCPKDVARLRAEIEKVDAGATFMETSIGPVIGSHVGPDMLAMVFWGPDRREDAGIADRIARRVKEEG